MPNSRISCTCRLSNGLRTSPCLSNFKINSETYRRGKWSVKWDQQPIHMMLFALAGVLLALGHHLFYRSLNGTISTSDQQQQWAHILGNFFAILVVTTLAAANKAAYHQYIWTVIRGKPFTLGTLDKLFALTSDPLGFFSIELLKNTPIAVMLALICWCITLAGLSPPGSLTIIQGIVDETSTFSADQLNWSSTNWSDPAASNKWPSSTVLDITSRTAEGMNVLPFDPPASNSSYSLEIVGPFLQCQSPNVTQKAVFEFYQTSLLNQSGEARITASTEASLEPDLLRLGFYKNVILSAFDPYLGSDGWASFPTQEDQSEHFNNWRVGLPPTFGSSLGYEPDFIKPNSECNPSVSNGTTSPACQMFPRQLWVVTSDDSFVCTLGTGTRIASFVFENGVQTVSYGDLTDFSPLFVPRMGFLLVSPPNGDSDFPNTPNDTSVSQETYSYMAAYVSLTNLLSGNLTAFLTVNPENPQAELSERTSQITFSGLDACDDFKNNYWTQNFSSAASLFPKPEYMCRNHTLAKGIEDLMANITLSMMTSSDLTVPNATNVALTISTPQNIYKYNSFYLVLSYSIAIGFSTFSVLLGVYAFYSNGVSHSTSFSAVIATTRSPSLDKLLEGDSMQSLSVEGEMLRTKLRFGEFVDDSKASRRRLGTGFSVMGHE